jgi:hypothetical protein
MIKLFSFFQHRYRATNQMKCGIPALQAATLTIVLMCLIGIGIRVASYQADVLLGASACLTMLEQLTAFAYPLINVVSILRNINNFVVVSSNKHFSKIT